MDRPALAGISGEHDPVPLDPGVFDNMVLGNKVVIGTVNAGLDDYRVAAEALAAADRDRPAGLITRRLRLDRFMDALERRDDDVRVVIDLNG